MEEFNLAVLILPGFSIIGVLLMYWYFRKKIKDKWVYNYYVVSIALIALVFNTIWELLHGPLYKGYQYDWEHISICLMAAFTDMLTTLIMLYGFGLFYENIFWIRKLKLSKIILVIITGGTGTILLERWHIAEGHWTYAENMPIVPWIEVGLTPLLQFTILPIVIFLVGRIISNRQFK
ncbi:hypothetical protein SAMN04487764_0216 [Gillisia sp. Hel1_33_143]|uniref:hypothetical protein n=1 Tax=unclassified Gillisia TaxID=2615025 RepID=UPI0005521B3E|nr:MULTISPECIES: hypothetical protein [unclassified Gillisia]SDR68058.1 hypothetical protein SAMN04487764_0216 [Gillisia sp. Hel1_33_143]